MHILIVDNDGAFRESLSRSLREAGHTVAIARDIADAISHCSPDGCDLVFADPGSQPGILVRIREFNPDIPVVVMSQNPSIESVISALRLGTFDYLIKPFNDPVLVMDSLDRARRSIEAASSKRAYLKRILKTFSELSVANESVRVKGYTNESTEIYFNQFFDDILAIELARSLRCNHTFTIVSVRLEYQPDSMTPEKEAGFRERAEAISDILHKRMRRTDVLVRTAVDEFMIILVETAKEGGIILVENLRRCIAAIIPAGTPRDCGDQPVCFGIAAYPLDGVDCQVLMEKARQSHEERICHAD